MGEFRLSGVRIDAVTREEAVAYALRREGKPCFAVTPNAVMLDCCRRDPSLAALLNSATLSLADGMGVLWAARMRGLPLYTRVAGIEFGEALLERAAREGLRVFLLGGRRGVAQEAAKRLRARIRGLRICGCQDGYFDKQGEADERVTERIRALRPEVLLVCFGFPLQERWIAEHLPYFESVRVAAGLGGALDVWAGRVRRAPRWIRRIGLEWAWRMILEPARLRNLPSLVRFLFASLFEDDQEQFRT